MMLQSFHNRKNPIVGNIDTVECSSARLLLCVNQMNVRYNHQRISNVTQHKHNHVTHLVRNVCYAAGGLENIVYINYDIHDDGACTHINNLYVDSA